MENEKKMDLCGGIEIVSCVLVSVFFYFINMGVRASLRAPCLIPRALKLTTM
jgi:hypothetical protein